MLIVDSQVHVWPPDRPDRPLLRDGRENSPYRYEQLLADMERAGVDRAILVPPSIEGDRNDYALEAAQNDWLDGDKAMMESLIAFKRAGAAGVLSYFAPRVAEKFLPVR